MRVVFLEDVAGVAQGGDVKEVKNGFARNYLIPQSLATPATIEALKRTKRLGQEAEAKRIKTLADMKELSLELNGAQVNVEMRAGASGRLYGSVTNLIVADEVAKLTDREIDRRTIQIPEPIRQIGIYEISIKLHTEVSTDISVVVYPAGTDPVEYLASLSEQEDDDAKPADGASESPGEADVTDEPKGDTESGSAEVDETTADDEDTFDNNADDADNDTDPTDFIAENTPKSDEKSDSS